MLKWAHENGCEWDERTCAKAAELGNVEMLNWLRQNGCTYDEILRVRAFENHNWIMMKWLIDVGCPLDEQTKAKYPGIEQFDFECFFTGWQAAEKN